MTITSYAAEKALVSGPVAGKLLGRLDGTGVVGLGLTVGPLRLPFAAKAPLLGPGDWKGVRFRVFNSPVQADAVRALGATPVNLSFSFIDELRAGTLQGAEFDIPGYEHNGYTTEAGHVTANVVLWPKVYVLALSKKRFDALTTQQQAWVRGAARQAVTASVDATYGQASVVRTLCDRGVRFADATPGQIKGLRAKLRPVLERLAAKPADAQLLRDIQTIANQHPGPEKLDVPASCQHAAAAGGSLSSIPRRLIGIGLAVCLEAHAVEPVALVDDVVIGDRGVQQEDSCGAVGVGNRIRACDQTAEGCPEQDEGTVLPQGVEHAVDVSDDVIRRLSSLHLLATPCVAALIGADSMFAAIDGLDRPDRIDAELAWVGCPASEVDDGGRTRAATARIDVVTIDIDQAFDGLALLDGKVDPGKRRTSRCGRGGGRCRGCLAGRGCGVEMGAASREHECGKTQQGRQALDRGASHGVYLDVADWCPARRRLRLRRMRWAARDAVGWRGVHQASSSSGTSDGDGVHWFGR